MFTLTEVDVLHIKNPQIEYSRNYQHKWVLSEIFIQFIQPSVRLAKLRLDTSVPQVGINPSSI